MAVPRRRARRILWVVAAIVVALPILLIVVVVLRLGSVIRLGVERAGPPMLGVETRLDDATVSILKGNVQLSGLHVANPEGFTADTFLKADAIRVSANIAALLKHDIHVRQIILEGPEFTYEHNGERSNVKALLARLESDKETGQKEHERKRKERGAPSRLKVDLIRITDARVNLILMGQKVRVDLASVELRRLEDADGNGIPVREVVRQLLLGVFSRVEGIAADSRDLKRLTRDLRDTFEDKANIGEGPRQTSPDERGDGGKGRQLR